jgi:hypothetical protein
VVEHRCDLLQEVRERVELAVTREILHHVVHMWRFVLVLIPSLSQFHHIRLAMRSHLGRALQRSSNKEDASQHSLSNDLTGHGRLLPRRRRSVAQWTRCGMCPAVRKPEFHGRRKIVLRGKWIRLRAQERGSRERKRCRRDRATRVEWFHM